MLRRPADLSNAVLLTHRDCMDGSGCIVAWRSAGGVDFKTCPAGEVSDFLCRDPDWIAGQRLFVISDLGVPEVYLADVLEARGNFVLLDHHTTSLHMQDREWATIDQKRCGTRLLGDWLGEGFGMSDTAMVIDDHDRWIMHDPRSESLSLLHEFYGQPRFVRELDRSVVNAFLETNSKLLEVLRERREEKIRVSMARSFESSEMFGDHRYDVVYVVSSNVAASELLHRMLDEHTSCSIACQIDLDRMAVSFRSRTDDRTVNVGEVARLFKNGGGHRCASGHKLDPHLPWNIKELVHGKQ